MISDQLKRVVKMFKLSSITFEDGVFSAYRRVKRGNCFETWGVADENLIKAAREAKRRIK